MSKDGTVLSYAEKGLLCASHISLTQGFMYMMALGTYKFITSNHGSISDKNVTYLSASLPVGDTAMLVLFTITFCMRPGLVSVR